MERGRLNFQYQLVDGVIDCSYANQTATTMGISDEIVERAAEVRYNIFKLLSEIPEISHHFSNNEWVITSFSRAVNADSCNMKRTFLLLFISKLV